MFLTSVIVHFFTLLESTNSVQLRAGQYQRHSQMSETSSLSLNAAPSKAAGRLAQHMRLEDIIESPLKTLPYGMTTPPGGGPSHSLNNAPGNHSTKPKSQVHPTSYHPDLSAPTISSKLSNSLQTVNNVTFLLNNLLKQYDNSLRPDLGGESLEIRPAHLRRGFRLHSNLRFPF